MTDYEILMIVLTILTLLIVAGKRSDRSCEPPDGGRCLAVLDPISLEKGSARKRPPYPPALFAIPARLSNQTGGAFVPVDARQAFTPQPRQTWPSRRQ